MQCKMAKNLLIKNGVSFKEINLDEQPEFIDQVKQMGFSTAPVITNGQTGESFFGFNPNKLREMK